MKYQRKSSLSETSGEVWKLSRSVCYMFLSELAFLTPPFLGGISAEVCEISPHNSDFL